MVDKENLLVLAHSSNSCYTHLVKLSDLEKEASQMNSVNPENLEINLKERKWSFHNWKNISIGSTRRGIGKYNQQRWGIIGIYDHTDFDQIKNLVRAAQEAVETRGSSIEY